jgi:hypothetical protein
MGPKIKKLTNGQKIALLKSGGQHTGDFINNKLKQCLTAHFSRT